MPVNQKKIFLFWKDLKRRRVIRVIIVYAATAFVILELTDIIQAPLRLPEWTLLLVIVLLSVGFIMAIILAWIFDITSKGIVKTEPLDYTTYPFREDTPGERTSLLLKSIVVLPFQNMSPDKDQEYFCDGITEEIINALTHIESLKVIARTTAFAFKEKYEDVRKIGRELNVDTVLEGSVRKAASRLRITAQLVKVSDGSHLWSERYDREMKDVFEIQDEISLAIVDKLKINLFEEERERVLRTHPQYLEAYSQYLRGRYHWNKRTKEGLEESIKYFNKSLEIDPDYTLAYTGLADAYGILANWGFINPLEALPRAKDFALKSLNIDASRGEIFSTLGFLLFIDWKWQDAENNFSKSLNFSPNYASGHQWYALYLSSIGHFDKALEHISKAKELDPLSMVMYNACGIIYYCSRQYDESIKQFQKVLSMNRNISIAHFYLSAIYLIQKKYDDFIREYQHMLSTDPMTEKYVPVVDDVYQKTGMPGFIDWLMNEEITPEKELYNKPYYLAEYFAQMEKKELAFKWLTKGIDIKTTLIALTVRVDQALDPLRTDPRFTRILQILGIT
jgi:adenylate cyclase